MPTFLGRLLTICAAILIAGLAHASSSQRFTDDMGPRQVGPYQVMDALYLPFVGDERFEYPDDVLFGFYPQGINTGALDCAEEAFSSLMKFLRSEPKALRKLISKGGTPRFVLWVNDYEQAALSRQRRSAALWHYDKRSRRDPRFGVWHWEATRSQTGSCATPSWAKAIRRLERALDQIEGDES